MELNRALRVLIVDDHRDAADTLAMLIEELGNEVQVRYSGRLGFQAAQLFRPHLILVDLVMPDIDGFDMATQIRQGSAFAGVTIVAITGYKDDVHRNLALSAGCDAVLVKPAGLSEIKHLLDSVSRRLVLPNPAEA